MIKHRLIHWYAKKVGRVTIPKWLYRLNKLILCDFCGENMVGKCDQIIDYGYFKPIWTDKPHRPVYIYAHKNRSDCDASKNLASIAEDCRLKAMKGNKQNV